MPLPKITYKIAKSLARQAIALKGGDFIYSAGYGNGCLYLPAKEIKEMQLPSDPNLGDTSIRRAELIAPHQSAYNTGCIIGTMLRIHGVQPEDLLHTTTFGYVYDQGGIPVEITKKAQRFMSRLQSKQDLQFSWQRAYDEAVTVMFTELRR